MGPFRIGVNLANFRQPLKRALQTAAQVGADAVEINARGDLRPSTLTDSGRRQFRKMLEDLRLEISAVRFQTRRGYHVLEDLDRRIDATKQAMSFAYSLGCPVVVNQIGQVPEDEEHPAWQQFLESISDIGRHGQRCGTMLAARTGTEDGPTLRKLIDALPDGSLLVDFDPGNLIVNGFSASEALHVLANHIAHVHARDGVQDLARGRGLEVALGRGSVDFDTLVATLHQTGYGGYFTVERESAEDPVGEIADAVRYLRQLG